MADAESTLSIEEAASRLGLHYMTVYRYVRLGRLPASYSSGRWHIDPADLQRVGTRARRGSPAAVRNGHTGPATAPPRPRGGVVAGREAVDRLTDRLLAGDAPGAWAIIESLLMGARPGAVYTKVVAPSMKKVGDAWAEGAISVADEHRATAIALGIVGRLGPLFSRPGRRRPGKVILAGAEGDSHAIPLLMVGDLLRENGFDVVQLGADVPAATLLATALSTPDLSVVGLSASTDGSAERVAAAITLLREELPEVAVILGGPAVADEVRARQLGADGWAADAIGAVSLVISLLGLE